MNIAVDRRPDLLVLLHPSEPNSRHSARESSLDSWKLELMFRLSQVPMNFDRHEHPIVSAPDFFKEIKAT